MKKQFCVHGHDTFVCGRTKDSWCNDCKKEFLQRPEQKRKAIERNKKYLLDHPGYGAAQARKHRKAHPKPKLGPTWVNEYSDGLLTLRNRKTTEFIDVPIDNEEIPYLRYFQWYPIANGQKKNYTRIIAAKRTCQLTRKALKDHLQRR